MLRSRPTCRFGPGEDKGAGAAAAHHLVAGVEVDAVDGEGLQQGDLDGLGRHLVLREGVFLDGGDAVRVVVPRAEAAVAAALGVNCAVRETKDVPPPAIWWPGVQKKALTFDENSSFRILQ